MAQEDMTQEDRELHVFLSYDTKKWCGTNLLNKVWTNK